ncbi:MAG: hypothetical protein GY823_03815 [Flavobacteriaceae bacterium]|nr:hypothetical protein [Flavobacteriaceae bacterium]
MKTNLNPAETSCNEVKEKNEINKDNTNFFFNVKLVYLENPIKIYPKQLQKKDINAYVSNGKERFWVYIVFLRVLVQNKGWKQALDLCSNDKIKDVLFYGEVNNLLCSLDFTQKQVTVKQYTEYNVGDYIFFNLHNVIKII